MAATIAIIGALEKEVRGIRDALEDAFVEETAGICIAGGRYAGHDVVATTAGMGTVNVAAATQLLISVYRADTVIFSGIAGGLNSALHIDDIVIGEHLRYTDTDAALIAESAPGLEEFASTPYAALDCSRCSATAATMTLGPCLVVIRPVTCVEPSPQATVS